MRGTTPDWPTDDPYLRFCIDEAMMFRAQSEDNKAQAAAQEKQKTEQFRKSHKDPDVRNKLKAGAAG